MWSAALTEKERVGRLIAGFSAQDKQASLPAALERELGRNFPLFFHAGLEGRGIRKFLMLSLIISLFVVLFACRIKPLLGIISAVLCGFCVVFVLKQRAFRRAELFERDYTALLLSIASSIRTGLDPLSALLKAEELFKKKSQVSLELEKFRLQIEKGANTETALRSFARSIDHPDVQLFRTAFILSRREGASLATCLQRLARVTRQRQSFRRKVRSAVAMQKLSALGIAACTVVIGCIQWSANPKAIDLALTHALGGKLLACGAGLILFGLCWMFSLARKRI